MLDGLGHRQHVAGVPGEEPHAFDRRSRVRGDPRDAGIEFVAVHRAVPEVGQRAVEVGLRLHAPREAEQRRGRLVQSGLAQRRVHHHHAVLQTVDDGPQTFDVAFGEVEIPAKLCDRADLVERLALPFLGQVRAGARVAPDHGHVEVLPDREGPGGNRRGGQFPQQGAGQRLGDLAVPVGGGGIRPIGNQARHRAGRDGRRVGAEHQCAAGTADAAPDQSRIGLRLLDQPLEGGVELASHLRSGRSIRFDGISGLACTVVRKAGMAAQSNRSSTIEQSSSNSATVRRARSTSIRESSDQSGADAACPLHMSMNASTDHSRPSGSVHS